MSATDFRPVNFKHIRFDKFFQFDDPPPAGFACAPIFSFVEDGMLAFLPLPIRPSTDNVDGFGRILERVNALQVDRAQGHTQIRQSELEETIVAIDRIVRLHRQSDMDKPYPSEEVSSWHLGQDFVSHCRLLQMKKGAVECRLSNGRELSGLEMMGAVMLHQAEGAIEAYIQEDFFAFAYLFKDVAFVMAQICLSVGLEDKKMRAYRHALLAHSGKPRTLAMGAIKNEFDRWQAGAIHYDNDADFAKKMHIAHPQLKNEGSIKNACTRWRRQSSN